MARGATAERRPLRPSPLEVPVVEVLPDELPEPEPLPEAPLSEPFPEEPPARFSL
ncbi:hypothetical protein NRB20_69740 [Nocardia sp. RB20]|uniref:Uncharacterized protein n=1 Tax=Nocardia macrotermitis TaxID=2585198 RepID=A0A7K0DEC4_9NOCA|nr:hypothetical protein [Nocardia macrotermitis]